MDVQPIAIPPGLALVLSRAGDRSGVDFDYLVKTAMRESSLDPTAKSQSSSATGLFQFVENTWLDVMKSEGPRLGYQKYADAIEQKPNGEFTIADSRLREDVLKLREDPQVAADMAAAYTRENGQYLQQRFGRMPSPGELYIAHFLGAQGAERLFEAGLANPDQIAVKLFPGQAAANPAIFYADGKPRTIREVYRALVATHNLEAGHSTFAAQQFAGKYQAPLATDVDFRALFTSGAPASGPLVAPSGRAAQAGFFSNIYSK